PQAAAVTADDGRTVRPGSPATAPTRRPDRRPPERTRTARTPAASNRAGPAVPSLAPRIPSRRRALSPHGAGGVGDRAELGPFVVQRQCVAADRRGEAALRRERPALQ